MNFAWEGKLKSGFGFGGTLRDVIPVSELSSSSLPANDTNSDLISVDEYWMREAFRESLKAVGLANPNPAVGCVIVKNGEEIARGHTQSYGGLHAERAAFAKIKNQTVLKDATVYVTLEPCSHFGHQPPCADLLAGSGVKRVVVGRTDPDVRVSGRGIQKLLQSGKSVVQGLLAPEITAWNYPFFLTRTSQHPFVALKWAQTLDGQLADDWDTSKWISGSSSRAYTHWLRQKYDVILVGAGTFLKDSPKLDVRDCNHIQRQPVRVIFDPRGQCLRLPEGDRRVTENLKTPLYIMTDRKNFDEAAADHWLKKQEKVRWLLLPPVAEGKIVMGILNSLSGAAEAVMGKPLQSIFVEGGPKLLSTFLREGFADIIHVFIAPKMTAGSKNRIDLTLPLSESRKYDVIATAQLERDVLIEMTPQDQWQKVQWQKNQGQTTVNL